jgi:ABC-type nitrate/sulfonate/bicarbonate transport system ATPase subunit
MTLLKTEILAFKFDKEDQPFFKNISLTLRSKEINFLVGLSGSGKTTLLKIIIGLHNITEKDRICYSINKTQYSVSEISKLGKIGFLSQNPALVPWSNILSNIELPSMLNKNLKKPNYQQIVEEFILVGLKKDDLTKYPHQISFGMQARVALVRSLIYKPSFIFFDELFTGIDTINNTLISKRIKAFVVENDAVCLFVSHDLERAISISDNIYMINGKQTITDMQKPFNIVDIISNLKK